MSAWRLHKTFRDRGDLQAESTHRVGVASRDRSVQVEHKDIVRQEVDVVGIQGFLNGSLPLDIV